jgi:radical SAM modification target selenobiotic family peptide
LDKEKMKRILAGICMAGLLAGVTVSTTGCAKEEAEKEETQTEEAVEQETQTEEAAEQDTTKSACSGEKSSCSG